jgi:hypothetical protein
MLEAASAICERQLTSREAVLMCRRWRDGKTDSDQTDALAKKIATLVRDHQLRHPETTSEQTRSALARVIPIEAISQTYGTEAQPTAPSLLTDEWARETRPMD